MGGEERESWENRLGGEVEGESDGNEEMEWKGGIRREGRGEG